MCQRRGDFFLFFLFVEEREEKLGTTYFLLFFLFRRKRRGRKGHSNISFLFHFIFSPFSKGKNKEKRKRKKHFLLIFFSYLERRKEGERAEKEILFSFFFLGEEIKEEKERQLLMSENKRLGGQGKNNAREVWRKWLKPIKRAVFNPFWNEKLISSSTRKVPCPFYLSFQMERKNEN